MSDAAEPVEAQPEPADAPEGAPGVVEAPLAEDSATAAPAHRDAPLLADGVPVTPKGSLSEGLKGKMDTAVAKAGMASAVAEAAPEMEKAAPEDAGGGGGSNPVWAEFVVKETQSKCKALFLPDGVRLKTSQLQQLIGAWELDPPNTLVAADAGAVHPRDFAVKALTTLPVFHKFWAQAIQHADLREVEKGPKQEEFALEVINDVIFLKLITIFVSVIEAADIANNYIIIDRISSKSPAAELLIEGALQKTTSRPVVLVVDSISRLTTHFKGEAGTGPLVPQTKYCVDTLRKIQKIGISLGTDDAPSSLDIMQFYNVDDFTDPANFFDLPLPRKPEPSHVLADGSVNKRFKWQYHYLQPTGEQTHECKHWMVEDWGGLYLPEPL